MTLNRDHMRVLLLHDRDSASRSPIAAGLRNIGCDVVPFCRFPAMPSFRSLESDAIDVVLGYGPHNGSMLGLESLRTYLEGRSRRPIVVWWLLENLPNGPTATWTADMGASVRFWLDGRLRGHRRLNQLPCSQYGQRWRILGELKYLASRGLPDLLVVPSTPRAEFLRRRGLDSLTVPMGYHKHLGEDQHQDRDIDVAFFGHPSASRRRRRILNRIEHDLKARNRDVVFPQKYLAGEDRIRFLNRCKVVINVLKSKRDSVGHRFLLCAANRALLVSEPVWDNEAFVSGKHFVTAPLDKLAETIEHYLEQETLRTSITAEAHRYVTEELTIENMLQRILERAALTTQRREAVHSD